LTGRVLMMSIWTGKKKDNQITITREAPCPVKLTGRGFFLFTSKIKADLIERNTDQLFCLQTGNAGDDFRLRF